MRRCLFALVIMCSPYVANGQTTRSPKRAPIAIKRAADPEVIEAAGANLATNLRLEWDGNSQEVTALSGCTMTISSTRTSFGVVTVDAQTFDAGDLTGGVESQNAVDAFEMRLFTLPKLRPFVRRQRLLYVEGAPKPTQTEWVVYLVVAIPKDKAQTISEGIVSAVASYRNFCRRQ
jgi:hypothetical protein